MLPAKPEHCAGGSGPSPPRGNDPYSLSLRRGPQAVSVTFLLARSLRPGAHLQAGSAKGCGREPSPQGDSDRRRHFGYRRPAPPLNPEVALRRPAEHRGAEPASTQDPLAAQKSPSEGWLPGGRREGRQS